MIGRLRAAAAALAGVLLICAFLCSAAAGTPSGARLWYRLLPSNSKDSVFLQTAGAPGGAVYAAGWTSISAQRDALLLAKYSAAGKLIWSRHYHAHAQDEGGCLAVDRAGDAVVAGWATVRGTEQLLTVKFTPRGAVAWVRLYATGIANLGGLVLDAAGNVYVSATAPTPVKGSDYLTVAYGANGRRLWVNRYRGPGSSVVHAMAVDHHRNVYLTGESQGRDGVYDGLTMKLSPTGRRLWLRRLEPSGPHYACYGDALAVRRGEVVVAGHVALDPADQTHQVVLVRYDAAGHRKWLSLPKIGKPVITLDVVPAALALDRAGNAVCVGMDTQASLLPEAAFIAKTSAGGRGLWWKVFWNRGASYGAFYNSLVVDGAGNAYCVGGMGQLPQGRNDFIVARWSPTGQARWLQEVQLDPAADAQCFAAALAPGGQAVYGAGYTHTGGPDMVALLAKYER